MASGNYNTLGRKKIMEFLFQNSDKGVTVQGINEYLIEQGLGVNITTIYRYLDKLTKENQVMKHPSENGNQAVYQLVKEASHCDEHLHLQCLKCGVIKHLDCDGMDEFAKHIKDSHGFNISCKNSIIYGLCEACQ